MSSAERAEVAARRAASGDLAKRLAVAAVGIPLAIAVTWAGGLAFALGLSALAATAMWEYARMLRNRGLRLPLALGSGSAALLPPAVFFLGAAGAWAVTAGLLLGASGWAMLRRPPAEGPVATAAATVFGSLYLGGLLGFGVPLREGLLGGRVEGTLLFFLPVAVTWLADTAAFVTGRSLGRRRLAPLISPNKTVAGAAGALVAGPAGAVAYGSLLLPEVDAAIGATGLALLGLLIAGAAILGDLVESALKRECAVKDSSQLLPGHGGLLDRLDSLLWAIPAAYLFLAATLGPLR